MDLILFLKRFTGVVWGKGMHHWFLIDKRVRECSALVIPSLASMDYQILSGNNHKKYWG